LLFVLRNPGRDGGRIERTCFGRSIRRTIRRVRVSHLITEFHGYPFEYGPGIEEIGEAQQIQQFIGTRRASLSHPKIQNEESGTRRLRFLHGKAAAIGPDVESFGGRLESFDPDLRRGEKIAAAFGRGLGAFGW
jgi:hypothetical protein